MHHDAIFDGMLTKATEWLDDFMRELETEDPHKAYRALRAVLQALRDRLSVDDVAQLASQLPTLLRGVLYEGWHPAGKPLRIRRESEFVALVRKHHGPGHIDVARALPAVLRVLERNTSGGIAGAVRHLLPRSLDALARGHGSSVAH